MIRNLGECVEFINGDRSANYPKQVDFLNGDIPFISASDLSNEKLYSVSTFSNKITESCYNRLRSGKVKNGDILLCLRGSLGKLGVVNGDLVAAIASSLVIVRPRETVNRDFLFQWMKSTEFQSTLSSLDNGSVQGNLSVRNISGVRLPDFSEKQQHTIAHILGTLDDKIELNQKMNQTLGDIAKAVFKSWFVDFDPVRSKAEGRPTGLPAEISDLFPDNLVDSEIGEIPAGWALKTIGDIADCVGGGTPSTKNPEFWDNGIHAWTTPKDLSNSRSIHLMQTDRKITDHGLKKISSGLLSAGTVLMSSRAPVGYLALTTEPTAINQGYIALRPKGTVSNYYLLLWCDTNLSEIKSRASGTTFAEISKASFRPIRALAPHDDVMSAFHRIVSPIYERVHISSKETQLLEDLRDTLLPKLISGELRIPDAEKFLQEAGI
jgi:type I restriction enzyme S subunit